MKSIWTFCVETFLMALFFIVTIGMFIAWIGIKIFNPLSIEHKWGRRVAHFAKTIGMIIIAPLYILSALGILLLALALSIPAFFRKDGPVKEVSVG